MTIEEIYSKEIRNDSELYHIHFYKSEDDWWRAYEWSACLCNSYCNKNDKKLKITHRKINDSISVIFVGMKMNSFNKYLPNIGDPSIIDENHIMFDISNKIEHINGDYIDILSKIKSKISIKQFNKTNYNNENNKELCLDSIKDVINTIISYPLESKSLIENVKFISNLKRELSKLGSW